MHIADFAGEWVETAGRPLIRTCRFSDLDRAPLRICKTDIGVAVEQRAVDAVAQVAVALPRAGSARNIEAHFELIDEVEWQIRQPLETAHTEIGAVACDRRHPAEIADREGFAATGESGVVIDISGESFGRVVERDVDVAVTGDLAAGRVE